MKNDIKRLPIDNKHENMMNDNNKIEKENMIDENVYGLWMTGFFDLCEINGKIIFYPLNPDVLNWCRSD